MLPHRKQNEHVDINDISIIDESKSKQAITAAALGNIIEWFDLGVYGYVAYILGKVFFPHADPSTQLIAALATFSVPFLFRPLGGILFGRLGDKYGRQRVLATTIILMTLSTCAIGLLPSYNVIGIWSPLLLLLIKILQGVSVGGEYSGAIIFVAEYAPDRKRGFMGSWLDFGAIAGFLLGASTVSLLSYLMGADSFNSWGWRIPFILSLPLGFIGMYLRHSLEETPVYKKHTSSEDQKKFSLKEIFTTHKRNMIVCIGFVLATNVPYYMLLTYLPSYFSHNLNYGESKGNLIILSVMFVMLFIQILIGFLSDKVGRKPFMFIGSFFLIFLSYPAFKLLNSNLPIAIIGGLAILALSLNMFTGVTASTLPALFPTKIRYSAIAIAYNVSVIIAGITPTLTAMLVETTHNLMIPAFYLMLFGVVGLITAINIKETANKPLLGGVPIATSSIEAKELLEEYHDNIEVRIQEFDEQILDLQKRRQALVNKHPRIKT